MKKILTSAFLFLSCLAVTGNPVHKIKLDNDKDTPLTITPDASFAETNKNDGVYVIELHEGSRSPKMTYAEGRLTREHNTNLTIVYKKEPFRQ